MSRPITKGSTDQSTIIRIVDSADGTPETGVTSATSGLDLKYRREGAAVVSITESDLAAVDSAHSDGGMIHIGAGYYRLDLPDAAFATGVNGVTVFGTVTGMVVIGSYHPLTDINLYDPVRGGMTALPNANADSAGGLPISDAGGLDLDGRLDAAITSRMATYTQPTGFLAATFPSTVASTTNITAGTITTVTNLTNAATAGDLTSTMKTSVETAITNRIVAYNLDHLCLTPTAAADMTAEVADNTILARILSNGDTSVFDPSTDGLQPIRDYTSPASTALSTATWTGTRAGYLDNLSAGAVALQSTATAIETDTQDIQSRLPASLVSGRMDSNVQATASALTFNLTGNITGNLSGSVGTVTGDIGGKVIGGGAGTITGIGVWALGSSGATIATATALAVVGSDVLTNGTVLSLMAGSGFDTSTDSLEAIRNYTSPASTALSTVQWTNTRAGYLDNLSAGAVALQSTATSIEADTQDIQSRIPAALVSGRMDSYIGATASALTFNLTGNITGDLSGSVGSVAGAVGSVTSVVNSNFTQILGTALTEGASGRLATAFITLFNVATPVLTTASVNQTGDSFARIGANGASLSAIPWNSSWDTEVQSECTDALTAYGVATQSTLNIMYGSLVSATGVVTTGATATVIPTNMTLAADSFNDQLMVFTSGNLSGRAVPILSNTTGGVFTMQEAFHAAPTDGSTFNITPSHEHSVSQIQSGLATAVNVAAVETDTQDIQSRLPAALVSGRMDSYIGATASSEYTNIANALLDLANGVETGVTPRQALRAISSILAGIISGAGTGTEVFKALAASGSGTTRVTVTVDSSGNRSAVTLNL